MTIRICQKKGIKLYQKQISIGMNNRTYFVSNKDGLALIMNFTFLCYTRFNFFYHNMQCQFFFHGCKFFKTYFFTEKN